MSMSDRVVVMRSGVIEQAGTPVELYRQPASLFVASFVGSSNVIPVTVRAVESETTLVELDGAVVRAETASGLGAGARGSLVLRAEAIRLESAAGRAEGTDPPISSLPGRIADVRFVGAMVHYRVDVPTARLHVIGSSQGSLLEEGDEVNVTWRPEDALLLAGGLDEEGRPDRTEPEIEPETAGRQT